jgi:hypothetical protein
MIERRDDTYQNTMRSKYWFHDGSNRIGHEAKIEKKKKRTIETMSVNSPTEINQEKAAKIYCLICSYFLSNLMQSHRSRHNN